MSRNPRIRSAWLTALLLLPLVSGCGTNFQDVLLQTGAAFGRSAIDLLLTDLANALADALEDDSDNANDNANNNDNDNDNDNDNGNDNSGGAGPGDIDRGSAIFADDCAVCHGADGASGFAPNIQGADENAIRAAVSGEGGHAPYDLSDQDIADVAAFLGSF